MPGGGQYGGVERILDHELEPSARERARWSDHLWHYGMGTFYIVLLGR